MDNEWREKFQKAIKNAKTIAIKPDHMPQLVRAYVSDVIDTQSLGNATPLLSGVRVIKSREELQLAPDAGKVATVIMMAGWGANADGMPEFEVTIVTSQLGTRKAGLFTQHYTNTDMSPNTHFLQIIASGESIIKTTIAPQCELCMKEIPYSSFVAV